MKGIENYRLKSLEADRSSFGCRAVRHPALQCCLCQCPAGTLIPCGLPPMDRCRAPQGSRYLCQQPIALVNAKVRIAPFCCGESGLGALSSPKIRNRLRPQKEQLARDLAGYPVDNPIVVGYPSSQDRHFPHAAGDEPKPRGSAHAGVSCRPQGRPPTGARNSSKVTKLLPKTASEQ